MCSQLIKNSSARCRGAGKKDLVHTGRDSIGSRLGCFVQQLQQSGVEAAAYQDIPQCLRRSRAAGRRLPQNGVASRQRLQCLDTRKKQRIVRWSDDEHNTEGLAAGLRADAEKPEGASVRAEPLRGKNPARFLFQKSAGLGQRQHFTD